MRAVRLRVTGIVQGVGFRPFIYRLAVSLGLKGYVVNLGGSEVEIHVEGDSVTIEEFLERLVKDKPPPARIERLEIAEVSPAGFESFVIRSSESRVSRRSMIPPDIGICSSCAAEIRDPSSRFYGYHWNSCAWCGPRFSMMYSIPYDRENTSMKHFPLCSECLEEYRDPSNLRRFHAQGISCPKCGPRTYIVDPEGRRLRVGDPLEFAVEAILSGGIIAIKGVGGYHIACLATDDGVLRELRRRKRRPSKPFALMARDLSVVERIAVLTPSAARLLESPERPIVILPRKPGAPVSELVAPGLDSIGVMLPYTGFQVLLLDRIPDGLLVMTSGNVHGRPMCTSLECVLRELRGVVDYIVEHERPIAHRVDDSVIRFTDGEPVFLRRSRGYAPMWLTLPFRMPEAIALGAELQVAGAVSFENRILPTQFIGDLDDPGSLMDLRREIEWLVKVYRLNPVFVAIDKHPLYTNRRLALELSRDYSAEVVEIQHHHAHAASLMAELGVEPGECRIAVTIDGTGYGDDGGVWGGEVLLVSYEGYERLASLQPYRLPGGDTAALYPAKPLIGLAASTGMSEEETMELLAKRNLLDSLPQGELEARASYRLAASGRAPVATSLGRVLDAFSALLGVCDRRTYEGEPPMRLEAVASQGRDLGFTPKVLVCAGRLIVDLKDLLDWVLAHMDRPPGDLARTILSGLGRALGEAALKSVSGRRLGSHEVLISGGASVNTYIVRGIKEALREAGLELVLHKDLPPGDGGVSVGQLVIGAAQLGYL